MNRGSPAYEAGVVPDWTNPHELFSVYHNRTTAFPPLTIVFQMGFRTFRTPTAITTVSGVTVVRSVNDRLLFLTDCALQVALVTPNNTLRRFFSDPLVGPRPNSVAHLESRVYVI